MVDGVGLGEVVVVVEEEEEVALVRERMRPAWSYWMSEEGGGRRKEMRAERKVESGEVDFVAVGGGGRRGAGKGSISARHTNQRNALGQFDLRIGERRRRRRRRGPHVPLKTSVVGGLRHISVPGEAWMVNSVLAMVMGDSLYCRYLGT